MKYVLISCFERTICDPEFFNTKEEAHEMMSAHIEYLLGLEDGVIEADYENEKDEDGEYEGDDEFGMNEHCAYINDDASFDDISNKGNWDFRIFECKE